MNRLFKKRPLLIATQHGKEQVIAPVFENALEVNCIVPKGYNTDLLGTFSGEIERPSDPITVLKQKCTQALTAFGYDLGIASEGSFGPHPSIPFAQANEELLVFIDLKNNLEILAGSLTTKTNYRSSRIVTEGDLLSFAKEALFPSHALILKDSERNFTFLEKGIQDRDVLIQTFKKMKAEGLPVFAETDMRAHLNPTRMKHIEEISQKLLLKIKQICPVCEYPGFDVKEVIKGLPCELCRMPTRSPLKWLLICNHCNHTEEKKYPLGKEVEEPLYCDYCNP